MAGGAIGNGDVDDAEPNPFAMPPEMEFFWLHKVDNDKMEAERAQHKDLRVWEKATAASKNMATRTLRDDEVPMAPMPKALERRLKAANKKVLEGETPDDTFLTTIATQPAVGVVNPLRKEERDLRSYVHKKREVFLVQMALDVKRAEITRLEETARLKEEALQKSQQMLDEDTKKFQEYLQERYSEAQRTAREAEKATKLKQEKLQRIRQIRQQMMGLESETSKLREVREECARYKRFFDKVTPLEWKEHQKQLKLERKARRRRQFIETGMAPLLEKIAEEERILEKLAAEEPRDKKRGKKAGRAEEEALAQQQREREARRRKLEKKRAEEEKRLNDEFVDVSSEEEPELYFKGPAQLMDTFTELEEKNLLLIQGSQETEQQLDELEQSFEHNRKKMSTKVQQLNDNISNLQTSINAEKQRRDQLQQRMEEQAGTEAQDRKLEDLSAKVHDVYVKSGLKDEHSPDILQMLGSIESKLEELIHGLDQAYQQDEERVMRLEKQKLKERSERVRVLKLKELTDKQEERLRQSLIRSQKPVFKRAGKQVMYRSPPLRQERKVVKNTTDEEANARDHQVFGMYIERKTQKLMTEPPVVEDPKQAARAARAAAAAGPAAAAAAAAEGAAQEAVGSAASCADAAGAAEGE
eukprot:TRINITY_DN64441_c0_g1_i1.p1 TRINITY_DN64441_c0_g1~~TRINITY_DN64441_c0_g1_i1.p1  ORF type:complete len:644 (+),score=256.46 TRINITY_DN64441_c0_g1_i1:193-2124(+)